MASSALGLGWYLDSGDSLHMTGDKKLFSDLVEKYLQMHIELGDDGRYSVTVIGTITFQKESGKLFHLKYVMHVPGLKKKLVSVAMLEDRGYDVVFSEGKVFLRPKTVGKAKKVGIRVKNLYRLDVDGIYTELPIVGKCEKSMQLMLEREQDLHAGKSEPWDVEQPQDEDHGVGETTHADKFCAIWAEGVHAAIPPGERWGDMHE